MHILDACFDAVLARGFSRAGFGRDYRAWSESDSCDKRRRRKGACNRISGLMAISFHDSSPCGFNFWRLNQLSGGFICATIICVPPKVVCSIAHIRPNDAMPNGIAAKLEQEYIAVYSECGLLPREIHLQGFDLGAGVRFGRLQLATLMIEFSVALDYRHPSASGRLRSKPARAHGWSATGSPRFDDGQRPVAFAAAHQILARREIRTAEFCYPERLRNFLFRPVYGYSWLRRSAVVRGDWLGRDCLEDTAAG
jgi:hypothetical protein